MSRPQRIGGRGRRLVIAIPALVALLWVALPAPAASAHVYLLASTPLGGYAVATSPAAITLDFDEPVIIGASALALTDPNGQPHPLGPAVLSLGGRRLSAPVPEQLIVGGYRVHWQATADDGDLVSGNITFAVGTGAAPVAGDSVTSVDSPVVVVARWVLFAGLALGLGGLVGHRLERRVNREIDPAGPTRRGLDGPGRPWPAVVPGAVLGALTAGVLAADQVGFDLSRLVSTSPGRVLLIELAGFLLAAGLGVLAHHARGSALWVAAGVPLLAVAAAEGFRAHPHASSPVWGTALTIVHLIAVSVWIGGLVHVLRVARHRRRQPGEIGQTRLLLYDYSRLALDLVALVIVTGTLEAVLVVPTPAALIDSTYGLVLLAKLALVTMVLVLAVLARRRLRRSTLTPSGHPLGRSVRGEAAGLIGVLAATAVLVSVAPAGPTTTVLAAAPPPVGPVLSAGTLAGQITVIATASSGQLVVHMTAPGRDDLGTDNADPSTTAGTGGASGARPADYRTTAVLTPPGADPTTLTLTGCGAGCFTSPVQWRDGTSQLSLDVAAPPSPAATGNLTIPWPPRTDPALLSKVLTAMRTVRAMTVHQAVTSNYTGYPGQETALPFTGTDFLPTEPYANGGGSPVVVATGSGDTEIRLAFPQGIAIRLFTGPDFRILREEATTPNHLITSTFEYPPGQG